MKIKLENIQNFLEKQNWTILESNKNFVKYSPSAELNLPKEYFLEIPVNVSQEDFLESLEKLTGKLSNEVYETLFSQEDFFSIFSRNISVVALRIIDSNTEDGTIALPRIAEITNNLQKIFRKIIEFVYTGKQIFGSANTEAKEYLSVCKVLPTPKSIFTARIEFPTFLRDTYFGEINLSERFFQLIDFVKKEVMNVDISSVNENYVAQYQDFFSVEILTAIRNLYKNSNIKKSDFSFLNFDFFGKIETNNIKVDIFTEYIKQVESVLLPLNSIEIIGKVHSLTSKDALHAAKNKVKIVCEENEEKLKINAVLDSQKYQLAIQAHADNYDVRISGIAKPSKSGYSIEKIEDFSIL